MRIIAGLLAVVILAGCSGKDKVPSGIIPREKMGVILWDMIQVDQYSSIYLVKDSARINIKMEDLRLYQQVFQLHGISRDEFRKSFQYYEDRPDLIRTLFDSVISRGNRLRTEGYSKPVPSSQPVTTPAVTSPVKTPAHPVIAPVTPVRTPVLPTKTSAGSSKNIPVRSSVKDTANGKGLHPFKRADRPLHDSLRPG
jgi:Domain of unknown function (DUF4296)